MEFRSAPPSRFGMELLLQCRDINITFGKHNSNTSSKKRKQDDNGKGGWKKKSIFFKLPYWEHLLIRHNLDVMHIEKNICDSIVGTLLNIEGKTKDILKGLKQGGQEAQIDALLSLISESASWQNLIWAITRIRRDGFIHCPARVIWTNGRRLLRFGGLRRGWHEAEEILEIARHGR
ncbi:hypothetical protein MRB53_009441 [Persea americana]|uniref:Uncharacterized protein n=1 Tax=Persea americana TaxID=3435 RepID=A0ACC2LQ38_PERAE|nr:hypothetical protein MRB53_009441 [Persea americana]